MDPFPAPLFPDVTKSLAHKDPRIFNEWINISSALKQWVRQTDMRPMQPRLVAVPPQSEPFAILLNGASGKCGVDYGHRKEAPNGRGVARAR